MAKRGPRIIKSFIVRVYALAILLAVLWTGYAAVSYLIGAVFRPAKVPEEFRAWKADVTLDALTAEATESDSTRLPPPTPIRHYHRFTPSDRIPTGNSCSTSGCHGPLPHQKSKELRAFANMHTTFMSCGMCHAASLGETVNAVWLDAVTGRVARPPAVLRLLATLDRHAEAIETAPAKAHEMILPLLAEVSKPAEREPVLNHLRVAMETSQPGSPVWQHAIDQLSEELPNHIRGDYAAVIAPEAENLRITYADGEMETLTDQYLAAPKGSSSRDDLYTRIHEDVEPSPAGCRSCHNAEQPRIDFASLGYTPRQADRFRGVAIADLMERIQTGEPFYLPRVQEAN